MSKVCLINQDAGLGDILLCQKIAHSFKNKGYKIIWPVINEYSYVKEYLKDFEFPAHNEDYEYKNFYAQNAHPWSPTFINFSEDNLLVNLNGRTGSNGVLIAKFTETDIDWTDWYNYVFITRNENKENHLFYNLLKLNDNEPYAFVNDTYGSPPQSKKKEIDVKTSLKKVYSQTFENITVFDWIKIIEKAKEIHMVDTVFNCLIDILNIQTDKMELFSRFNPAYWGDINLIFKPKWNYNS